MSAFDEADFWIDPEIDSRMAERGLDFARTVARDLES